ncbi:hypothetical protein AAHA92_00202 [Salvia divinorum]|uniref:Uncharacterized protein n=1 Tax=Salvia divinorum TaxID=28513 RepID=A0ABD1IIR8_SALDI
MIEFLDRMSKKKSGRLCYGGLITSIAHSLDISFRERVADIGPTNIHWDVLKQSRIIKVDSRRQGYFLQNDGTQTKFPNPQLFDIGGWSYQDNWKMLTEAHLEAYGSDPLCKAAP